LFRQKNTQLYDRKNAVIQASGNINNKIQYSLMLPEYFVIKLGKNMQNAMKILFRGG
jgi:hypothetical protein